MEENDITYYAFLKKSYECITLVSGWIISMKRYL